MSAEIERGVPFPTQPASPGGETARPTCGARTRAGTPCRAPGVKDRATGKRRARCKLHGGLSTGPKTVEGRARCADAARRAWADRRARARNTSVEDGGGT